MKGYTTPTIVEVVCTCGKHVNIRVEKGKSPVTEIKKCWNCLRVLKATVYAGIGKVNVYIDETQLHSDKYRIVWQGD